ncbi:DUF2255 family protein [Rubellicoccus peritrichatus]|uniref:DUF2255 family protein n=1 Tax=Rubellicoccus peritrichatus TaxID=3080537 RepID=A0AAQ3QUN3_9BACT|nr:DUF2255 family protein [Puniceicoccus sp. CR14]WOO40578.1 DUF2255 family protein [Puniceicoccus sp. CR14]
MTTSNKMTMIVDLPKLFLTQIIQPLRLSIRSALPYPESPQDLADLVNGSLKHEIRAGYTHRFIPILFVTVGDRVFCRRYTYGEPSWHSAFRADPPGQIKLDKTIVNIEGRVPADLNDKKPAIDQAYADKLKKLGARFMLAGAIESRAQESTMELILDAK